MLYIEKHSISASLRTISLLFCAVLFSVVMPANARAVTLDELHEQVEAAKVAAQEARDGYESKKAALDGIVNAAYKNGSKDITDALLGASSFGDVMNGLVYGSALTDDGVKKVQEAREAQATADEAIARAEELAAQEESRIAARENARYMHFTQWKEPWAGIPYWGGTIASAGCGLIAYTVAMNILTGSDYTPATMLDFRGDWSGSEQSLDSTYGTPDGSTHAEWTYANFGVESIMLPTSGDRMATLDAALAGGESAIQICASGYAFKDTFGWRNSPYGHYITIYLHDEETDTYYVQDSSASFGEEAIEYSRDEMSRLMSHAYTIVEYRN